MSTAADTTTRTIQIETSGLMDRVRKEAAVCAAKRMAADPTAFSRMGMTTPEESFLAPTLAEATQQLIATCFGRFSAATGSEYDGVAYTFPTNVKTSALTIAAGECDSAIVAYTLAKWYELSMPDLYTAKMEEFARHTKNVSTLINERTAPTYTRPTTWDTKATTIE